MRNTINFKTLFGLVLCVKIVCLILFSSQYNQDLFYPFVKSFVEGNLNPWQYYYSQKLPLDAFPYHGLMLIILAVFSKISIIFSLPFLFKIPLLLADIGIFYLLLQFFTTKKKQIFLFYFVNPIIIYSTYIHCQLDIIPTFFIFYSVYTLTKKQYIFSAILFGLALATKFHVIIALPLLIFYLYKIENFKLVVKYPLIVISLFLLLDIPFIFSVGFNQMVFLNSKQSLLFDSFYSIHSLQFFLPIAAILLVYFTFINYKKINYTLLYFYLGLLFTIIILFIYPAPAWYIWGLPFIVIYFIQNVSNKKSFLYYIILNISYLLFFLFFYQSEYQDILFLGTNINLKINNSKLINISFTILEISIIAVLYIFYQYGIKSNSIYNKQDNLVIGIGGDSGVGKSTLILLFQNFLGSKMLQIEGDGEHKWERGNKNWSKYTHLDPKANYIHKQANAIYELKKHHSVLRSDYDHHTGTFTKPYKIIPKDFIVIAGLHPFYLPKMRKFIDIKIYLDTDENLRRHWKIIRDIEKRSYNINKIMQQIENRIEDAHQYIYPQKQFADLIIHYFPMNNFTIGDDKSRINIGLKLIFDANIDIDFILHQLDAEYTWNYNDDLKSQYIQLTTEPKNNFEYIATEYIQNIQDIISVNTQWKKGYEGFLQLLLIKIISEKLKENTI